MSLITWEWQTIKDAIESFGWVKGTFTLFFWAAHYWIYRTYSGRLRDRQNEIDRLAADNREYRERFLSILDKHFEVEKQGLLNISTDEKKELKEKGKQRALPETKKPSKASKKGR